MLTYNILIPYSSLLEPEEESMMQTHLGWGISPCTCVLDNICGYARCFTHFKTSLFILTIPFLVLYIISRLFQFFITYFDSLGRICRN